MAGSIFHSLSSRLVRAKWRVVLGLSIPLIPHSGNQTVSSEEDTRRTSRAHQGENARQPGCNWCSADQPSHAMPFYPIRGRCTLLGASRPQDLVTYVPLNVRESDSEQR